MERVFELASSVSTPLALGGFFAAVVFFVFRQIVAKNIFPKLTASIGAQVLTLIIERLFALALVAMVLGFIAYLITKLVPQQAALQATTLGEGLKIEQIVTELESPSVIKRLLAISQLDKVAPANEGEADNLVRVLEAFINRRAAFSQTPPEPHQTQDIVKAFASLSTILNANAKSFNIRPPEFKGLDLSSLDLSGVYLRRASFFNSTFDDAILDGSDLADALLMDVQFSHVQARNVILFSARFRHICAEESIFDNSNLSAIEASSSDFNGTSFRKSNLSAARFDNTRLSFAALDGANLTQTDLTSGLGLTEQQLQMARFTETAKIPNPLYIRSRLSVCKGK
jgi:uncharacterized protein YjbI with pentapeptide repeats